MKTKLFGILILVIISFMSCKDKLDDTTYFTANILSVTQRLELGPDTFSNYVELLRMTEFYSSLQTYGNYTCFVPTNEAIQTYINERWGVSSVNLLSDSQIDEMKYVLKFHILPVRKLTNSFNEGRISDTTYTGDFLTTSFAAGGGINNLIINKQSKIVLRDVRVDNGVIHVINRVLDPFIDPLPVVMEKNGKFNIFSEALKKTGYFDDFSVILSPDHKRVYFTIMAESDLVYHQANINSFNDLADSISPGRTDYLLPSNPLNQFMAYHVIPNFYYSGEFPKEGFLSTQLENAAIKIEKTANYIKFNESESGVNDTWISIILAESNNPAKNGVYHSLDKIMHVFTPKAKWIIFDPVSSSPEWISGLVKVGVKVPSTTFQYVSWYPESNERIGSGNDRPYYDNNLFDFGTSHIWYEFITPVIPKGKYEFLILSYSGTTRGVFQIYWDGEPVGAIYPANYANATTAFGWPDPAVMESYGWRLGFPWVIAPNGGQRQSDNKSTCRFIITKELLCPVQQRHTIRVVTLRAGSFILDFFEFIPVN